MTQVSKLSAVLVAMLTMCAVIKAQEVPAGAQEETKAAKDEVQPAVDDAVKKIDEVVEQVDQSEQAQNVKSNILAPIYSLAERFSFPAFHWLAFAVMVTGVVSFALQLVLGKLVVLSQVQLEPDGNPVGCVGIAGKSHRFGAHDPGRDRKLQFYLQRVCRVLGHRGRRASWSHILRMGTAARTTGCRGPQKGGCIQARCHR